MSRLWSVFGAVVAVALIVVGFWAVIRGVIEEPSIVGSFATAAGAILAVAYQRDRESKREVARLHREQLAPFYESLFERFAKGFDIEDPEQEAFIHELQRKLLFYGSTRVVEAWLTWIRSMPDTAAAGDGQDGPTDPSVLLRWEQVLFAIRRDLGHSNGDLGPGDLLRVYVYDADEHVQPSLKV